MSKVSMIAKLIAKPGQRDVIVDALNDVRPLLDAEEGTEQYSIHLDQADENTVWIVEVYRDQAALDAHFGGAALAQLFGAIGDAIGPAPELHAAVPIASKGVDIP